MTSILVVYESLYGHTAKIAEYVSDLARYRGHTTCVVSADRAAAFPIASHAAAVICAPVYYKRHPPMIESFVRRNAALLTARPCAFISVSGAAASKDPLLRLEAHRVAQAFLEKTGLRPKMVITVGGALSFPRYGFLLRHFMRYLSWRSRGQTDTSRVHELTDWGALDDFTARFLDLLDIPRLTRETGTRGVPGRAAINVQDRK